MDISTNLRKKTIAFQFFCNNILVKNIKKLTKYYSTAMIFTFLERKITRYLFWRKFYFLSIELAPKKLFDLKYMTHMTMILTGAFKWLLVGYFLSSFLKDNLMILRFSPKINPILYNNCALDADVTMRCILDADEVLVMFIWKNREERKESNVLKSHSDHATEPKAKQQDHWIESSISRCKPQEVPMDSQHICLCISCQPSIIYNTQVLQFRWSRQAYSTHDETGWRLSLPFWKKQPPQTLLRSRTFPHRILKRQPNSETPVATPELYFLTAY
jgi:hypothetical protein